MTGFGENLSPQDADAVSGQTPNRQQTLSVYQAVQKTCKGPCGRSLPGTPEHFSRCKKYKDGLDSRCKACARQRRRERARLAGQTVEHPPRYYRATDGQYRCMRCHGQIYDSGFEGEWTCLVCGAYVNPPPKPARMAAKVLNT